MAVLIKFPLLLVRNKTHKTMKPTQAQIKAMVTEEMVQAANAYCMAKAYTQTIRPIVEGYQREILVRNQFTNKGEQAMLKRLQDNGRHLNEEIKELVVLNPDHTYLMSDEDSQVYFVELEQARIKSGLKVEKEGNCPLLEAESMERTAVRVLIDVMEPITKINYNQVINTSFESRAKLIDLSIGLIASLGLLKNTLKKVA